MKLLRSRRPRIFRRIRLCDAIDDLLPAVLSLLHVSQAIRNSIQAALPKLGWVGLHFAGGNELRGLDQEPGHVRLVLGRYGPVFGNEEFAAECSVEQEGFGGNISALVRDKARSMECVLCFSTSGRSCWAFSPSGSGWMTVSFPGPGPNTLSANRCVNSVEIVSSARCTEFFVASLIFSMAPGSLY